MREIHNLNIFFLVVWLMSQLQSGYQIPYQHLPLLLSQYQLRNLNMELGHQKREMENKHNFFLLAMLLRRVSL
jgi:hypothetical protein